MVHFLEKENHRTGQDNSGMKSKKEALLAGNTGMLADPDASPECI